MRINANAYLPSGLNTLLPRGAVQNNTADTAEEKWFHILPFFENRLEIWGLSKIMIEKSSDISHFLECFTFLVS